MPRSNKGCAASTEALTTKASAPQPETPPQWEAHLPQRVTSLRTPVGWAESFWNHPVTQDSSYPVLLSFPSSCQTCITVSAFLCCRPLLKKSPACLTPTWSLLLQGLELTRADFSWALWAERTAVNRQCVSAGGLSLPTLPQIGVIITSCQELRSDWVECISHHLKH